jgi:hypothetical protein
LGDKPIWKKIWKCNIPEKMRIFAWKALSNGLATEENKRRHHMPVSGICRICGNEKENTYHALVHCHHASALWDMMMMMEWYVPRITTPIQENWLETWLLPLTEQQCGRILMIVWRVWHVRNEITHDKPMPSIGVSHRFICSYLQSLENIRNLEPVVMLKGKQVLDGSNTENLAM